MKGMRGNGREKVERLFWANGAAAGKAYNRSPGIDAYWPHGHSSTPQYILWSVVPRTMSIFLVLMVGGNATPF
jgi:hypothetical protein